jgi:hypothetical protein
MVGGVVIVDQNRKLDAGKEGSFYPAQVALPPLRQIAGKPQGFVHVEGV